MSIYVVKSISSSQPMCSFNTSIYPSAAGGRLREPEEGVDRLVPFLSGAGHHSGLDSWIEAIHSWRKRSCRAADSGVLG